MKTKSRNYISDHSNNSQIRVRCSANPQVRVEQRPFQRYHQAPFINYEHHKRQMNQRRDETHQMPRSRVDLRPLVIEEPMGLGCGPVQGYRIVIRGSPEYRF